MRPANILWIGQCDHANLCNRVARALNAHHGATVARVWTLEAHPFRYPEDLTGPDPTPELEAFAATADWTFTSGDGDYWYYDRMRKRLGIGPLVRQGTTHAGSAYRATPDLYDEADRRRGFEARFIGLDSLRLVTEGHDTVRPYVSPAPGAVVAALPMLGPAATVGPVRVAHAPSSRGRKGSDVILPVLDALAKAHDGHVVVDIIENVPADECAKRLAACHVLVDSMEPSIAGIGCTAVEAMAVGVAVVSDVRNVRPEDWARLPLGERPIAHVEDADALRTQLEAFVENPALLLAARRRSLEWAQACVSPAAVARAWDLDPSRRSEPVPTPAPPMISAAMIVKNEEPGIRAALTSLIPIVDEVVIVDTGSTDRTVAIIEEVQREWDAEDTTPARGTAGSIEAGAKRPTLRLYHEPWREDFAWHRNDAQARCKGDWVVVLDGDEVFAEAGDLRANIHGAPNHGGVNVGVFVDGTVLQLHRAYRRGVFMWMYRVHNQLVGRVGGVGGGGYIAPSTANIEQSYDKGSEVRSPRRELLIQDAAAHPTDAHSPTYLGRLAAAQGDWTHAKEFTMTALQHGGYYGNLVVLIMALYVEDGLDVALRAVDEALTIHPAYADLWHLKANLSLLRWHQTMVPLPYQNETVVSAGAVEKACRLLRFRLALEGRIAEDGSGDV